eukprot:CAMPEP_0197664298 /NCGR_PEP_ID=MMETSP1338-20131121/58553_1 /TAXON_ID=43686 ORGANISM="Pelagodinium beii, Strain RCC1491" /NCGR_SAMPLE_ID=MMETSP1338 /ASSEMBLY_ACC=CAM_ASM_000754 /LENGTH=399 /DNA_ID=CAMNT_0043242911 /DNA_START=34 /DNA_END=1233 /DNA_ORIENTATION=+
MSDIQKCRCCLPEVPDRIFKDDLEPHRVRAILNVDKKWVSGTVLRYYFFSGGSWGGSEAQKQAMRKAFKVWEDVGIGLRFLEVTTIDAEIRIGFEQGAGSWSYMGRDILSIPKGERTMNIGWDITNDIDTGVHEIGHTMGFPHEHQNPNAGMIWDVEAVYADLGGPPNNWSREQTYHNIIRKLDQNEVQGSTWDPNSIMHYPFRAGLILQPEYYQTFDLNPTPGLSQADKDWVRWFYPPLGDKQKPQLQLDVASELDIQEGETASFDIKPDKYAWYNIRTVGHSDTYFVLFQKSSMQKIASDDDSGEDKNASVSVWLESSKEYSLELRLFWFDKSSSTTRLVMTEETGGSPSLPGLLWSTRLCNTKGRSTSSPVIEEVVSKDGGMCSCGDAGTGGCEIM